MRGDRDLLRPFLKAATLSEEGVIAREVARDDSCVLAAGYLGFLPRENHDEISGMIEGEQADLGTNDKFPLVKLGRLEVAKALVGTVDALACHSPRVVFYHFRAPHTPRKQCLPVTAATKSTTLNISSSVTRTDPLLSLMISSKIALALVMSLLNMGCCTHRLNHL